MPSQCGGGPVCSIDNWCWSNPLYQGNNLRASWVVSPTDVWVVGDYGMVLHFDGTSWASLDLGIHPTLNTVWATGPNNVWVAGYASTLRRWNGTLWEDWDSSASGTLWDFWGLGPNDLWAVGGSGIVRHWDGTAWTTVDVGAGTLDLISVSGTATNDIWVSGEAGTIRHFNGTTWSATPSGATVYVAVSAFSSTVVWAVGDNLILKWNGSSWVSTRTGIVGSPNIYDLWISSANDVWIAGLNSFVARFNGTSWTQQSPPITGVNWHTIMGAGSTVFAFGEVGSGVRFNGTTWSPLSSGTLQNFFGVFGTSPSNVWAFGVQGQMRRFDGSTWTTVNANTTNDLFAAWGASANDIWVVGSGTLRRWNGTTWTVQPNPPRALFDVRGLSANDIWACGDQGLIMHYDGTSWSVITTPATMDSYNDILPISPTNVWSVGDNGLIGHWNGTTWQVVTSPTTSSLHTIAGSGANDVFAGGRNGTLIHFDGTNWSDLTSVNLQVDIWAMVSEGAGRVTLAGGYTVIGDYSLGNAFTYFETPSSWTLYGLWASATSPRKYFGVGESGMILIK